MKNNYIAPEVCYSYDPREVEALEQAVDSLMGERRKAKEYIRRLKLERDVYRSRSERLVGISGPIGQRACDLNIAASTAALALKTDLLSSCQRELASTAKRADDCEKRLSAAGIHYNNARKTLLKIGIGVPALSCVSDHPYGSRIAINPRRIEATVHALRGRSGDGWYLLDT